jgi:hypothetical protein
MNTDWGVCALGESSANFSEKIASSLFTFILFKEQIRDKCMIKIREDAFLRQLLLNGSPF